MPALKQKGLAGGKQFHDFAKFAAENCRHEAHRIIQQRCQDCAFQGALAQSRKGGLLASTGFERNHGVRALRGQLRSALGDARFQLLARLA